MFDKDSSGLLSTGELRDILTGGGEEWTCHPGRGRMRLTREEVEEMVAEVDR